jgi:hypothetical protein
MLKRVGRKCFSMGKRVGNTKGFVEGYMKRREFDWSKVEDGVKKVLRKEHYQGKVKRFWMFGLMSGLQAKEDALDKEMLRMVVEPDQNLYKDFLYAKETLEESGIFESFKGRIDKLLLKISKDNEIDKIGGVQGAKERIISGMGLYNESIQALVEGQREVMQNPKHVLDSGETVEENVQNFKNKVKDSLNLASMEVSKNVQKEREKYQNNSPKE